MELDIAQSFTNNTNEKDGVNKFIEELNGAIKNEDNLNIVDKYEAFEDDGYIFLNDLTEERDFSIEDIDFVVDCYQGDGTYQVIDGEYRKIED